ncbi:MAG: metallophosphoesterase [Myxococcales bacterium]|nr:MAG: metallophosphoesterase [Myxococcales bacterium]
MATWQRFAIFLGVGSILIGGWHYYLWTRLVRDADLPPPWRTAGTAFLVAMAVMMPLALALGRSLPAALARPLAFVAFTWMGLAFLLFFLLLVGDAVKLVLTLVDRVRGLGPSDPERRTAISRLVAGAAAVLGVGAGAVGVAAAFAPRVERVRVPLVKLPASLAGLRIVQLTDIHVGQTVQRGFIEALVAQVNALDPDVIAITGDLVDGSVEQLREHVAPLAGLRARHGVYFVTGNHEYYSGVPAWVAHLTTLGVRVLRNERVRIGDERGWLDLAGVDDFNAPGRGSDVAAALAGRDPATPCVLLAHQPRSVFEAGRLGVDLQLSGHTHGGQIVPWNLFVRLQQPFIAGLDRHLDTWVYTSRGTGFWGPPMRVGIPGEIAEITLATA